MHHQTARASELDPEAAFFWRSFEEPKGVRVLEVGAHDAPLALMLAEEGYDVTGVDLRPYDFPDSKHKHVVGNLLDVHGNLDQFDVVLAISTLEHFGLGAYGEGKSGCDDGVASVLIWDLVRSGGCFYVLVPLGGKFVQVGNDWRVYDWNSFLERIVQKFRIDWASCQVCEEFMIGDRTWHVGDSPGLFDVLINTQGFPGISLLARLVKD